jgi:hypothetical protein
MRFILFMVALVSSVTAGYAATPLGKDLIGIWETKGSEFRGEALIKGHALYLDSDGVGAMVGAPDYSTCIGIRVVVTSWDSTKNVLKIDLTDNGKTIESGTLNYDPTKKTIVSPSEPKEIYRRRAEKMSAGIRESIGLESKSK